MQITSANDMNGDVVSINTRIKTTIDKQEYTAVITGFEHYQGNVVKVVAILDENGIEIVAFSDAVVRFKS
jgi:hypothetical protein